MKIISKRVFLLSTIGICSILNAASVTSCSKSYSVSLKSDCLELVGNTTTSSGSNYICSFKIKDDLIKSRYMDNIDVDKMSVTVNGKNIDVNGFSFIYQTNAKNQFTIQKEYINGKIEINADLTKRTQKHNCFYFEYDINQCVDFSDFKPSFPLKVGHKEAIDKTKTKTTDDIYLKDEYDMAILTEQEAFETLGKNVNLFIVREDNALEVNFKSNSDKPLPKNIWFRSNARYTKKGEDFTLDYSSDYMSATLKVPYFFIRDNGSFRCNPDVEA